MATALPRPPNPIPPSVPRYDTTGRPERVQVEYERRVHQFLVDVDDAINEGLPPSPPAGPVPLPPQPVINLTAGRTLILSDAGAYMRFNLPLLGTAGIDQDANVNFPIGTLIEIEQTGIGAVQLSSAGNVSLLTARPGTSIQTTAQYTRLLLRKVAANTWVIY